MVGLRGDQRFDAADDADAKEKNVRSQVHRGRLPGPLDAPPSERGRLRSPARLAVEDRAGAVSFLLGPDAAWITGQTMTIDGGVTLGGAL